jgi:Kef-type K+ transport system membrane component KefB
MKKKLILFTLMLVVCTGCTEFAILASGSSIAISQNIYAKTYSGADILTIIKTDKDIKAHVYEVLKNEKKTND